MEGAKEAKALAGIFHTDHYQISEIVLAGVVQSWQSLLPTIEMI
jgi:hypothetical protein